jgi:hypothetical protein
MIDLFRSRGGKICLVIFAFVGLCFAFYATTRIVLPLRKESPDALGHITDVHGIQCPSDSMVLDTWREGAWPDYSEYAALWIPQQAISSIKLQLKVNKIEATTLGESWILLNFWAEIDAEYRNPELPITRLVCDSKTGDLLQLEILDNINGHAIIAFRTVWH